jgi:hypothetical protein
MNYLHLKNNNTIDSGSIQSGYQQGSCVRLCSNVDVDYIFSSFNYVTDEQTKKKMLEV